MADNIPMIANQTVMLASDEIDGVHHPRQKIQFGAEGSAVDVSASNPLPVSVTTANALPVSGSPANKQVTPASVAIGTDGNPAHYFVDCSDAGFVTFSLTNNSQATGLIVTPFYKDSLDGMAVGVAQSYIDPLFDIYKDIPNTDGTTGIIIPAASDMNGDVFPEHNTFILPVKTKYIDFTVYTTATPSVAVAPTDYSVTYTKLAMGYTPRASTVAVSGEVTAKTNKTTIVAANVPSDPALSNYGFVELDTEGASYLSVQFANLRRPSAEEIANGETTGIAASVSILMTNGGVGEEGEGGTGESYFTVDNVINPSADTFESNGGGFFVPGADANGLYGGHAKFIIPVKAKKTVLRIFYSGYAFGVADYEIVYTKLGAGYTPSTSTVNIGWANNTVPVSVESMPPVTVSAPIKTREVSNGVVKLTSAASSTNKTFIIGSRVLKHIDVTNTQTAARYLKLYDASSASAVTVGTTVPMMTIPLPASSFQTLSFDTLFPAGIVAAITAAMADSDTQATTGTEVRVVFSVQNEVTVQ